MTLKKAHIKTILKSEEIFSPFTHCNYTLINDVVETGEKNISSKYNSNVYYNEQIKVSF